MAATFPNGIASFPRHRNLFDDVDAEDINRLQDEVVALQETMGALVNEVHSVETNVAQVDATLLQVGNEINQVANAEAANAAADQLLESQTNDRFASVKDRLDYIQSGRHMHAFEVSGGPYRLGVYGRYQDPDILPMPAPVYGHDPMGMYNGAGFTLKKSGFWVFTGSARFDVDGKGSENAGMYQASLSVGGIMHRGIDRAAPVNDDGWLNVMLNPIAFGWFGAGTTVYLRGKQTSQVKQTITTAILGGFMLREF